MANSRFASHVRLWFFFIPLLAIFLMPIADDPDLFKVSDAESDSVVAMLGQDRADDAVEHANEHFKSWFIETGAVKATLRLAEPSDTLHDSFTEPFADRWAHNFWYLIYRMVYRATVMKFWIFGTILMGIASFTDGWAIRKIRAAAGGVVRPLNFHVAAHGILLVLGVVFTMLMLPVTILAPFWVVVAAVLVCLLWRAASSYQ